MSAFLKYIKKGFLFSVQNPQIIYTSFLLVVIPVAFLFTSQMFLDVSRTNQESLERRGISLMHDAFVSFASLHFDESELLQEAIESIALQNQNIDGFRVLEFTEGSYTIIASLNEQEIGGVDDNPRLQVLYRDVISENSKFLAFIENDERHWGVVREIQAPSGEPLGIVYTSVSMQWLDDLIASKLVWAYGILVFVIMIIGFLLIRQAKVIDYAVLYKRLKEVDQMKDDFVSMAAHELRTPLTIIRGYTEMLSSSKRLTETDRQMTSNITQSANHLNQLIGDILDVSRLQQGRLSFNMEIVQPETLINDVVESLKYTASQKGLALAYEPNGSADIHIDIDRLKQVLINVIGNSIKYTLKGEVRVKTYVEKNMYTIRVSDTGIGMSADDQQKLFTRFYRVRTKETENIRGTGLGLWITKEIVTQMKGEISVESIKGKGTDFIIRFAVDNADEKHDI
jgi:signal transduction histidine kinase